MFAPACPRGAFADKFAQEYSPFKIFERANLAPKHTELIAKRTQTEDNRARFFFRPLYKFVDVKVDSSE